MLSRRFFVSAGIGLVASAAKACTQPVDGADDEPISESDIERRLKLRLKARPQSEQTTVSRQEVVNELREERRILREAERRGIKIADAEVDEAYARMGRRMRMTPRQLDDALTQSGIAPGELRMRIRVDLTLSALQRP